jgi:predicted RNA-binding Zn-ribbon protein involved in translation (DUF1610 family)
MTQERGRKAEEIIHAPKCPSCGTVTQLARIEPDKPDHDRRIFRCPQCGEAVIATVKYR